MAPYLSRIPSGARLLDAGCGRGEWVVFLGNQGYEAHGVDISQKTINLLQEKFPEQRFHRADIRQMDFEDGYFDMLFSWGVFEHFEDGLGKCVEEAYRVLKPGGYLCITVPFYNLRHSRRDRRPLDRWDNNEFDSQKDHHAEPAYFYQWRLTERELERELAYRGFNVLRVQPVNWGTGASRMLRHDFNVVPGTKRYRILRALAKRFVPKRWISHMLMAIVQK